MFTGGIKENGYFFYGDKSGVHLGLKYQLQHFYLYGDNLEYPGLVVPSFNLQVSWFGP
jgi:hypothetical protein